LSQVIIIKAPKPRELNSEAIKKAMLSEGFTTKRLSDTAGITERELKQYLKTKSIPRGIVLLRIGKALNLDFEEVTTEKHK